MTINPEIIKRRLEQRQRLERAALLLEGRDPGDGKLTEIKGLSAVQIRKMLNTERQRFMAALFTDMASEVERLTGISYEIANKVLDRINKRLGSGEEIADKDLIQILNTIGGILRPIHANVLFAGDPTAKKSDQPGGGLSAETVNILVQQIHQARRAKREPTGTAIQAAGSVPDGSHGT